MEWYHYIAAFFAGAFLANTIPHLVKGISGDKFPSPFAKPPGKGLSSAVVNVIWGLFNLLVAYVLFRVSRISQDNILSLVVFFAGIALMSIQLGSHFQHKDKE